MWSALGSLDAQDWYILYLVVAMLAAFAGGIWILFDASNRFGSLVAFFLVLAHLLVFLATKVPLVLVLYVIFWLLAYYFFHRAVKEDRAPRFGLRISSGDPEREARATGLPSRRPSADEALKLREHERIADLEELLARGKAAEALAEARRLLAEAPEAGAAEVARKYIRRIERGEY